MGVVDRDIVVVRKREHICPRPGSQRVEISALWLPDRESDALFSLVHAAASDQHLSLKGLQRPRKRFHLRVWIQRMEVFNEGKITLEYLSKSAWEISSGLPYSFSNCSRVSIPIGLKILACFWYTCWMRFATY